jgi:hypothetical protein
VTPYTLYDFLSFIIPGATILAAVVFGWTGGPHSEPGVSATAGILAASFVVGHLNGAVSVFLEPLAWGARPGTRVQSLQGLFGPGGRYNAKDEAEFMDALRRNFPGGYGDQALFDLAYAALQREGKDEATRTLNQQIGFHRNTASACVIAGAAILVENAFGHNNLTVVPWLPLLGGALFLLVACYRRFWVHFGSSVIRAAVIRSRDAAG